MKEIVICSGIKLAIGGGYDFEKDRSRLLDPLFWQALGKSLGWDEYRNDDETHDCDALGCSSTDHVLEGRWKKEMHSFIDHLISGKTPESFFENLLTNTKIK